MYSNQDHILIDRRIRKKSILLGMILLLLLAVYIACFISRIKWGAMLSGAACFAAGCFGITFAILPDLQYRRFLKDLDTRLEQEIRGTILSVSEEAELRDGAMVFPVHIQFDEDQEDHVLYLNTEKAKGFPPAGTSLVLQCCGRHIRSVRKQDMGESKA